MVFMNQTVPDGCRPIHESAGIDGQRDSLATRKARGVRKLLKAALAIMQTHNTSPSFRTVRKADGRVVFVNGDTRWGIAPSLVRRVEMESVIRLRDCRVWTRHVPLRLLFLRVMFS